MSLGRGQYTYTNNLVQTYVDQTLQKMPQGASQYLENGAFFSIWYSCGDIFGGPSNIGYNIYLFI